MIRSRFFGFPTGPFTINRASPQAAGLVGWWVPAWALIDFAYFAHLMSKNGTSATVDREMGRGALFNGSSDYLTISSTPLLRPTDALTVNVWYRPDTSTSDSYAGIVGHPYDNDASWNIPYYSWAIYREGTTDTLQCRVQADTSNTGYWISTANGFANGILYMATITYDTITRRLYINGVPDATSSTSNGSIVYDTSPAPANVNIGQRSDDAAGEYFGGEIYDVRVYNRVLSADEVWQLYDPATRWDLYQPIRPIFTVSAPTSLTEEAALTVAKTATLNQAGNAIGESAQSLGRTAAVSNSGLATGEGAQTLGRTAAFTGTAAAATDQAATLARSQGLTAGADALAEAAATLTAIKAIIQASDAQALADANLIRILTTLVSDVTTVDVGTTLTRLLADTQAGQAASEASSSLSRSESITLTGTAAALADVALAAIKLLTTTAETITVGTFEVSVTISRTLATVIAGNAAAEAVISTLASLGVPVTAAVAAEATVALSQTEGFTTVSLTEFDAAISLAITLTDTESAGATAVANASLLKSQAINLLADAAAAARVDIAIIQALVTSATTVALVIVTPTERTFTVPVESRTFTVPVESRTLVA